MDSNFIRYKELEKRFDFRINGVSISKTATFSLYRLANGKSLKWRPIKLLSPFWAFDLSKLEFDSCKHVILSTGGLIRRRDYQEMYDYLLSQLADRASKNLLFDIRKKIVFHPGILIRLALNIKKAFREEALNSKEKVKFFFSVIHLCNTAAELDKIKIDNVKKYLSFENTLGIENMLTQYFKNKGIPTYSSAEGMYMWYPECDCIDAVHHENIETDHLICWGQYSVDEFIKAGVDKERLLVGGYPHPVKRAMMKAHNPFGHCVVLLTRKAFESANLKLIEILSKGKNTHFSLKLHPTLTYSRYEELARAYDMDIIPKHNTINECLDNEMFDFAIAVNTTAYYEALMRGVPCLRFSDGSFKMMKGYDDIFYNLEDYEMVLEKIKAAPICEYQDNVNEMLRYTVGYGTNNYKKILLDG